MSNRKYTSQIDYVFVNKWYNRVIRNLNSCRGADINLDHFLVTKKQKHAWKAERHTKQQQFKKDLLKADAGVADKEINQRYFEKEEILQYMEEELSIVHTGYNTEITAHKEHRCKK